jgi:hypothetical protein
MFLDFVAGVIEEVASADSGVDMTDDGDKGIWLVATSPSSFANESYNGSDPLSRVISYGLDQRAIIQSSRYASVRPAFCPPGQPNGLESQKDASFNLKKRLHLI